MPAERDVADRTWREIRICVTCALIAVVPCAAEAQKSTSWWPFSSANSDGELPKMSDAPPVADPPQYLDEATSESTGGWANIHLPEVKWRPLWSRPGDPQQGLLNGPVDRVRAAGRNTVASARGAWNGTVDKFKWGGTTAREEQYARRQEQMRQQQANSGQQQPGFWDRLLGKEPEEPDGPKTVVEWMAQERPGMTK
jgi:hypothetical protein